MSGLAGLGSRASLLCPWQFVGTLPTSPWAATSPGCREERLRRTAGPSSLLPCQDRLVGRPLWAPWCWAEEGLWSEAWGPCRVAVDRVWPAPQSLCAEQWGSGTAAELRGTTRPESWDGFWSRSWPWAPFKYRCFLQCGGTTHVLRLSWSPDGHYLVSAHAMNNSGPTAQIIEREGWKTNMDFVGHRKAVTVVVSPQGLWSARHQCHPSGTPTAWVRPCSPGPGHVGLRRWPPRASTHCRPVLLSFKLITEHILCMLLADARDEEYHQSQALVRTIVGPAWPFHMCGPARGHSGWWP